MEAEIVAARAEFPDWGGRKLARVLTNRGIVGIPAPSPITEILRRHGMLDENLCDHKAWQRFERDRPNELWQMDFKGDFPTTDGKRFYPLTACDDHSRFNLILKACDNMRSDRVAAHLKEAFGLYGFPQTILCDNDVP